MYVENVVGHRQPLTVTYTDIEGHEFGKMGKLIIDKSNGTCYNGSRIREKSRDREETEMEIGDLVGNATVGGFGSRAQRATPALIIAIDGNDLELYQPGHSPNREWRPSQVVVELDAERKAALIAKLSQILQKWESWDDGQLGPLAKVREAARIAISPVGQ